MAVLSRFIALLLFFAIQVPVASLLGGIMGRPGPLSIMHYKVASNTVEGVFVGIALLIFISYLFWFFMIKVPSICIKNLSSNHQCHSKLLN